MGGIAKCAAVDGRTGVDLLEHLVDVRAAHVLGVGAVVRGGDGAVRERLIWITYA